MMRSSEDKVKIKSLSRALNILDCYTTDRIELGITEICDLLNLNKSHVHNVVSTFEHHGYLVKNPENNKYRLGFHILKLSNIINSNMTELDFIRPHIRKIAKETNEIVYYGILNDDHVLYLDYASTSGTIHERPKMGVMAPTYCSATGKAMMAYLPTSEVENFFKGGVKAFTEQTII